MSARDFLNNKPWLGWVVAGAILLISVAVYWKMSGKGDPYSVERLSQDVTIKCVETGDEWTMQRGLMERELRRRTGLIDPTQGLPNPKTGRLTGFPFDKDSWEATVRRLNEEKLKYDPALKKAPANEQNPGRSAPQGG